MRVLYISSDNVAGGASIALLNIATGMRKIGHEVLIATPYQEGPFLDMLRHNGINYIQCEISLNVWNKTRNIFKFIRSNLHLIYKRLISYRQLVEITKSFNPDIIHSNVGPLGVGIKVAIKCNVKHVWHQREYQDLDFNISFFPSIKTYNRLAFSKNNYNICITRGIFDYRHFRKDIDCIIYDGVFSGDVANRLNIVGQKEKFILFAGRIQEAKGAYDLINVFARFNKKYPEYILKIAGSFSVHSDYYNRCNELVNNLRLTERVHFLGERTDIYDLMSHAKMLVVPSRFEGFGFITAEAMLNDCVVVGRNTAGTKEQFDKGLEFTGAEIGYRFSNDDEMLDAMCNAVEDDTKELRKRAQKTVLRYYTTERSIKELDQYYNFILSRPYVR